MRRVNNRYLVLCFHRRERERKRNRDLTDRIELLKRTMNIVVDRENRKRQDRQGGKKMNETTMSPVAEQSLSIARTFDPRDKQDDKGNEIEQTESTGHQQRRFPRAIVTLEDSTDEHESIHSQSDPND